MTAASLFGITAGLILSLATLAKAMSPEGFASAVDNYEFLPRRLRWAIVHVFPVAEGILALTLFVASAHEAVIVAGACLFFGFAVFGWLILGSWRSKAEGPACGCLGGKGRLRITPGSVLLNIGVGATGIGVVAIMHLGDSPILPVLVGWGLAPLIAAVYWLTVYALSVLDAVAQTLRVRGAQ